MEGSITLSQAVRFIRGQFGGRNSALRCELAMIQAEGVVVLVLRQHLSGTLQQLGAAWVRLLFVNSTF